MTKALEKTLNIKLIIQLLSTVLFYNFLGRDSVMAMHLRNDLEPHMDTNPEEKDADLLRRLEELLVKDNTFFDIEALRLAFQLKDKQKTGKISNDEVTKWFYTSFFGPSIACCSV